MRAYDDWRMSNGRVQNFLVGALLSGIIIFSASGIYFPALAVNALGFDHGDLVKASGPSVYYFGQDGKRYVFPNEKTYFTWYKDFGSVRSISDQELAALTIGGNVTYRPGVKMLKIESDPKVYAVSRGGVLHWIKTELVARDLYGENWNTRVDDISPAFFVNYELGTDIEAASDYSPLDETASTPSIDVDKGLSISQGAGTSVWAPGTGLHLQSTGGGGGASDTIAPSVSLSAPADGATVFASVAVSATASDAVGVTGVQFKLDGSNLGAEDTTSPYSITWDSTGASDGSHALTAVARDSAGNSQASTAITVTVDNTGPVLSSISSGTPGLASVTTTWATDENSDSQVEYGTTASYGATTTLDSTLTTSHSVVINGLANGTLYHFRVRSTDAQGNLSVSSDQTFTTAYYGSLAAAGSGFDSYASVLSLVANGDDLLVRDSTTPGNNYSGVPYSKFGAGADIKYTFASDGFLDVQNYLFRTQATSSSVNLPDGQGGDTGEGFTCTGATWDGSAFWVGNDGGNVSGDSSRFPSIVRVSQAGAKLDEIDIGTLYSDFTSIQGVAWDSSDNTLWVAQVSSGQVRHVTTSGTDVGDGFALAGVNGLAYDSSRDRLWALAGTTLTLRQKDGTIDATYSVAALSDQLFYDADRDYIWVTNGANGSTGNANAYDASNGSLIGTTSFSDATAIEGLVILDGDFYVFHDGYYHAADGAVIQKNQFQVYPAVKGSADIAWATDHDPLNANTTLGYPIEASFRRLNGVPKDFDNAQWSKSNVTVSANVVVSPTGSQDAELFTAGAGTGARYVTRAVSVSSTQYVSTVIVKAGTHNYVWIGDRGDTGGIHSASYDLSSGMVIGQSNATGVIRELGAGWYRVELQFLRNNATAAGIDIAFGSSTHSTDRPSFTFLGTETLNVFAAEIGAGVFATSPVLNESGVETRNVDVPVLATSAFDFSSTENTFIFGGTTARGVGTSTQVLFQVDDGTSSERYRFERDTSSELHFIVTDGGVEQTNLNFGVVADNTSFKVAIRAKSNDFAGSLNGGVVVTDTSGTLPTVTTFRLGHSNLGEQWSAPVLSAASIPLGLDDATLQTRATP